MMIIFLIIGIFGSLYMFNLIRGKSGFDTPGVFDDLGVEKDNAALKIIQNRFASGEISRSEYNEMRNIIIEDEDSSDGSY
ncbi:MAG: hypothetical protein PF693_17790 [Spirochaetia bacterium]|jgi:uncharacterized membrane protein|nr:hypothetical protein [Spirochaetia bacterium]